MAENQPVGIRGRGDPNPGAFGDQRAAVVRAGGKGRALTAAVTCRGLAKAYGQIQAVDGVDLDVAAGEIVALLGPSGCGKTTVLRLVAGFERADAGRIDLGATRVLDTERATFVAPQRRGLGIVFQDYALFPHLDVASNVGYPLGRRPDRQRVAELLELVGLEGLGERRPHECSGGQQQRVALARALAASAGTVLLDEPFSNLDAGLRATVRGEVRRVLRATGTSAVLVTHDQDEALSVADRVAVMRAGRIEQVGTPEAVYGAPASRWVAEFLGDVNALAGEADGTVVQTALGSVPTSAPRGPVEVLIRPEHLLVDDEGQAATVTEREYLGHHQKLTVTLADGTPLRVRHPGSDPLTPGSAVRVRLAGPVTVLAA